MKKGFESFLTDFTVKYGKNVFENNKRCKSLLNDEAKGEYKGEIRLLMQALEIDAYAKITTTKQPELTAGQLERQLHDEYFIDNAIAADFITLLYNILNVSLPKKPIHKKNINKGVASNISKTSNMLVQPLNRQNTLNNLVTLIDTEKIKDEDNYHDFISKLQLVILPVFKKYKDELQKRGLTCSYTSGTEGARFSFDFFPKQKVDYLPEFEIRYAKNHYQQPVYISFIDSLLNHDLIGREFDTKIDRKTIAEITTELITSYLDNVLAKITTLIRNRLKAKGYNIE